MMKGNGGKARSRVESSSAASAEQSGILVAYFSWSGSTREVARQIQDVVGGRLFEIVSVDKYPSDYNECVDQAKKELDANYFPKLVSNVEDIDSYDVVIVGYPNWWGTIPRPVASFLSKCDSPRKTIAPFCTHGGDRLGESAKDIAKLCPHCTILDALAVSGGNARNARGTVSDWLRRIGIVE